MTTTTTGEHWHVGTGFAGYGPESDGADTCTTLLEVANAASDDLRTEADYAYESANALAESGDFESAWAALKLSESLEVLSHNLDVNRRKDAPLFTGPDGETKLVESMAHLIADAPWDVAGGRRVYVWTCTEAECVQTCAQCGATEPSDDPTPDQRWLCVTCLDGTDASVTR